MKTFPYGLHIKHFGILSVLRSIKASYFKRITITLQETSREFSENKEERPGWKIFDEFSRLIFETNTPDAMVIELFI